MSRAGVVVLAFVNVNSGDFNPPEGGQCVVGMRIEQVWLPDQHAAEVFIESEHAQGRPAELVAAPAAPEDVALAGYRMAWWVAKRSHLMP